MRDRRDIEEDAVVEHGKACRATSNGALTKNERGGSGSPVSMRERAVSVREREREDGEGKEGAREREKGPLVP